MARPRRKCRLSREKKNRVFEDWKRAEAARAEADEARAVVREALRTRAARGWVDEVAPMRVGDPIFDEVSRGTE